MEIQDKKIDMDKIRDDVNLFLWNNNFSIEDMKVTNQLIEDLKKVKIKF